MGISVARPASSRVRWIICALLFWVTTANYIDRSVFGNLAPEMPRYLQMAAAVTPAEIASYQQQHAAELAEKQMMPAQPATDSYIRNQIARQTWDEAYWNMQMIFSAAFAVSMLVMGRIMDVLGLRWGFVFACAFWGVASMLHAVAPEIGNLFGSPLIGFFICRALLGFGEGGNIPAAIKTTTEWFPQKERALATGLFNSGSNVGGLLAPWMLPWMLAHFATLTIGPMVIGWRGAFIVTAAFDLCWIVAWLMFYAPPAEHPGVSADELELIRGKGPEPSRLKVPWSKLLPHRQTWAIVAAKGCTDCFWIFFLFATPDLFYRKFGLSPDGRKYLIMFILVITSVGSIAGGWLSGKLIQRGWSINRARKGTMLVCALATVPVFYAAITTHQWVAAILITLAASGHQAWMANVLSLVGDMFPKRVVGSVTGFAGLISASVMMVLFYFTGKVLKVTGNYLPVFILASIGYLLALLLVHLLAPRIEPAPIDHELVS